MQQLSKYTFRYLSESLQGLTYSVGAASDGEYVRLTVAAEESNDAEHVGPVQLRSDEPGRVSVEGV